MVRSQATLPQMQIRAMTLAYNPVIARDLIDISRQRWFTVMDIPMLKPYHVIQQRIREHQQGITTSRP